MADYSTGLELILNASEGVLQIAITDDEKPLCFEEWFLPKNATEILSGALDEMCRRLGTEMKRFRRIGCFAGPGSFTGIRLVLSTAAAIRRVTNAQLARLDYLQALATSAAIRRGLLYPEKIFVITHARRGLLHAQEFTSYGPVIPAQPVNEVELVSPGQVLQTIAPLHCHVCGSGLDRYHEYFAPRRTGCGPLGAPGAVPMPELVKPDLGSLCLLARHGDYFPRDVEPKYVRPCDAVENLPDIAEKQGLDKDKATEKLHELLNREPSRESAGEDRK